MAGAKQASNGNLELREVQKGESLDGIQRLWLHTSDGPITTLYHEAEGAEVAVVWVGGAGGGLFGPAGGLYLRLAQQLTAVQIASLRLDYRYPNHLENCTLDTLLGVEYLNMLGISRIILVGHSFGGAVVVNAGAEHPCVVGVVALSSQTYGTSLVDQIAPRPVLFMHGTADEILPHACSRDLYQRAKEPKQLILYSGCRHGLDECRQKLDSDLLQWIQETAVYPSGSCSASA